MAKTEPQPVAPQEFWFAQITDLHYGNVGRPGVAVDPSLTVTRAVQRLLREPVRFVICTGDMTENFAPDQIAAFLADVKPLRVPLYCTPGNHDLGDRPTHEAVRAYEARFGPACSDFVVEDCAFIGMNTMLPAGGATLRDLAEKQLVDLDRIFRHHAARRHKIVYTHVPLFLDRSDEGKNYWNVEPGYRAELLKMFDRHKPTVCMSGHLHRNHARTFGSTYYQTSTALSFQLGSDRNGFRLWRVNDQGVATEYIEV